MNEEFSEMNKKLVSKKLQLQSLVDVNDRGFFHLRTLDNFIYHFNEISSESDRIWIYKTLDAFIDECYNYINCVNSKTSKSLYEENLKKTIQYYRKYLGFTTLISLQLIIFLFCLLIIFLGLLTNFYISVVSSMTILVIYLYFAYRKYKEKRVFGLYF
jgi:hypothetical protein